MAKTTQKKALIIGGGIAGPAAAIALQRVGIDAIVYEARQTSEQNKGAFLTVARNGINALHTIDAFEAVMARGFWVSRMEIYSGTGKRLGEMGSNAEGVGIERSQLASALCDEAIRRGIPVQTGKRLINVRTTPDGVTVQFEDGSLAKCLRDSADFQQALRVYEALRRPRVEKVAKLARRANQTKVAGPILRGLQDLLLPVVFKYLVHPEAETWLYHYRIDWDEQRSTEVVSTS